MSDLVITKRCCRCKQVKSVSDFHKDKIRKDGLHTYCKNCASEYDKNYCTTRGGKLARYRYNHSVKYKIASKRYLKSEKGKAKVREYFSSEYAKQYRKRYCQTEKGKQVKCNSAKIQRMLHPEWIKAQNSINHSISALRLSKPSVFHCRGSLDCYEMAQQYHHHLGYAPEHWLDVQPVCRKCHKRLHTSPQNWQGPRDGTAPA